MNYRSISPHLNQSCYNCKHFQADADMLNGLCFIDSHDSPEGVAAIGIGTCSRFLIRGEGGSSFKLAGRARRSAAKSAAVIR